MMNQKQNKQKRVKKNMKEKRKRRAKLQQPTSAATLNLKACQNTMMKLL